MSTLETANMLFDEGMYKECIALLRKELPEDNWALDELQLILSGLNAAQRELLQETATYPEIQKSKNNKVKLLQELLKKLSTEQALERRPATVEFVSRQTIDDDILVVCQTRDDADAMQRYFSHLGFTRVVCKVFKEEAYELGEYRIIVFNAHKISNPDNPGMKEQAFISEVSKNLSKGYWIVFYGEHYEELKKYRDTCYAANSRFSLYARLREMLAFLDQYKMD